MKPYEPPSSKRTLAMTSSSCAGSSRVEKGRDELHRSTLRYPCFRVPVEIIVSANHTAIGGRINIAPHFLVILATVVAFHRLDRMAGWCLVPLVVWIAFASVLNFAIWGLNGRSTERTDVTLESAFIVECLCI